MQIKLSSVTLQSPEIVYGFGFSSSYKGLTAVFLPGKEESFFIDLKVSLCASEEKYIYGNTLLKDFADNHWSPENQNLYALYPRLSITGDDLANNAQRVPGGCATEY
ncbi:hypothetical protein CS542_02005 [Pedobacter sp. IW39]|nr:hypothetical protein CS542_02005 [Pedobacter sp. IW39]